jgi:hypothetical protein
MFLNYVDETSTSHIVAEKATTMNDLKDLNDLLDKAKTVTGSDYETAKRIKSTRQMVWRWRNGTQTCPPTDQALLAHLAGLDAPQMLARATIKKHLGTEKGDLLLKALGKLLHPTGEAIALSTAAAMVTFSTTAEASNTGHFIRCILC